MSICVDIIEEIRINIITKFQKFCNDNGWTHEIIAEKVGCSRSHISKIFEGKRNPSTEILRQMEKLMHNE